MLKKLFERIEFTGIENLALARVQPLGLHLFEFIFYVLLGILALFALRSFFKSMVMILFKPGKEDFLSQVTDAEFTEGECASCGWKGMVPIIRKRCPKCGGTAFM